MVVFFPFKKENLTSSWKVTQKVNTVHYKGPTTPGEFVLQQQGDVRQTEEGSHRGQSPWLLLLPKQQNK